MSKICQITGKTAMTGNNVSHAKNRSRRTFEVNLQSKKFFIPEANECVALKVSASGIRHINKVGISAALKKAKENGYIK